MASTFYNNLSKEGQILVNEAMDMIRPGYDKEAHLMGFMHNGRPHYYARGTMYYALGLMLLDEPGCADEVEAIVRAVANTQYDTPKEIFHGCFDKQSRPTCPEGVLDYERLGLYGRYYMDVFYERMVDAFRLRLQDDPALAEHAAAIEKHLNLSTVETQPLVWTNYEPNSREFVLMCYAMLLEHFSDQLSDECIRLMEHSSRIGMEGAIIRSKTRFSPLNTNIQCMHVFLLDYFGVRFNKPEWCAYGLEYAEMMVEKYLQYHAAAEYNSPTYCGVDLATLGFWGRYGSNERLRDYKRFDVDVLFICINGKLGNMNVEEAIKLTEEIGARVGVPTHYGMFAVNTEDPTKYTSRVKPSFEMFVGVEYDAREIAETK